MINIIIVTIQGRIKGGGCEVTFFPTPFHIAYTLFSEISLCYYH